MLRCTPRPCAGESESGGGGGGRGRKHGAALARGSGRLRPRAAGLPDAAGCRDRGRRPRHEHGSRLRRSRRQARGGRALHARQAADDGGLDARLDGRRPERAAVGHRAPPCRAHARRRRLVRRSGARGRARGGARGRRRARRCAGGRQDDGGRARAGRARSPRADRPWRAARHSGRRRAIRGRGRNARDGAAPGVEGPRVVPRGAEHRPSGSRRDLDCARVRGARARRHRRAMSERVLVGLAAAGGVAVAGAFVLRDSPPSGNGAGGECERARALQALADVAEELGRAAVRLRAAGLVDEAEILEANRLMSEDPSLESEVAELALELPAAVAVARATDHHASLLAGLDDPLLAARAADVRELGRRAARLLSGAPPLVLPDRPVVLVARDLGPAEISDLQLCGGTIAGIALAEGAATSHAAIMARALGLPLVVGLGEEVLGAADGETLVLDADRRRVVLRPAAATVADAEAAQTRAVAEKARLAASRGRPAVTRDSLRIALLSNAATVAEVRAGLDAGAEGVGLLRTELAFLEAGAWPGEAEHFDALVQPLALLAGRVATVRTLDFGEDKTPPFLAGIAQRGLELTLAQPAELRAQLRAVLRAGAETRLRILFPLVRDAAQM